MIRCSAIPRLLACPSSHADGWRLDEPSDADQDSDAASCDRCGDCMDDDEIALGWPVAMGEEYVCPSCYGQEAYCRDGHVLPAAESAACAACALAAEVTR